MVSTRRTSQPEVDEAAGGSSRSGRRLSEIQKPTARRTRASQDAGIETGAAGAAAKKGAEPEVATDEDSAPDSNDDSADGGEVQEQRGVSKAAAAADVPAAKSGKGKAKAVASKSKPAAAAADASLLQAAAKAAAAVKTATKAPKPPAQHAKRGAAAAPKPAAATAAAAAAAPLAEEKADEQEHKEEKEEEDEEVTPCATAAPAPATTRATGAPVQRQGPSEPPVDVVPAAAAAIDAAAAAPVAAAAPKFHYEFMGPWGPIFIMLVLPLVVLGLAQACTQDFCIDRAFISSTLASFDKQQLSRERLVPLLHSAKAVLSTFFSSVLTLPAAGIFFSWMALQVVLERLLPAEVVAGVPLADGSKLKYRINGHLVFWVTLLLVGYAFPTLHTVTTTGSSGVVDSELGEEQQQQQQIVYTVWQLGRFPLEVLYDRFTELAAVACLFSAALSIALYAASKRSKQVALAAPGTSGFLPYDLFMGRELNPRFSSSSSSSTFDLKFFCELRPGLIGWTVLNIGMLCKQLALQGALSPSMLFVVLAQGMYVWDALYNERSVLTTMDITSDGFGFMLVFGDLAWVPFTYSLQAKYLVDHTPQLPLWHYALVVVLHCVGYALFRGANSQKDLFRRDPTAAGVSHLKFMQTQRGTKLLTSGYWGLARKVSLCY
jgi:Delta14-sterol reductase